jgi:type IV pilus assembly protein PilM
LLLNQRRMALPFLNRFRRRRDQVVAVDLGSKVSKAVQLSGTDGNYAIDSFATLDVPGDNPAHYVDVFADHVREIVARMGGRCRQLCVAISVNDSLLRQAEMPMVPLHDMRTMLRFSSKNYLQQDLSDCVFDCHILPPKGGGEGEGRKAAGKCRVLVGASKRQLVADLEAGAKKAGMQLVHVAPNFVGPPNAFERSQPEQFKDEAVALIELGQKNTAITVLDRGELALNRVVNYGSERLTQGIADALGISEDEAEGAKLTMPPDVESYLSALLMPLGRELRASIDFFDHQHDRAVSQAYFSGGAARSSKIIENLQVEMMVPCSQWDPLSSMQIKLPPEQMGEVEQFAPQLAVAVGAGLAALD